ncbi:hypothetical protein AAZX31_08G153500 [Glycine max]
MLMSIRNHHLSHNPCVLNNHPQWFYCHSSIKFVLFPWKHLNGFGHGEEVHCVMIHHLYAPIINQICAFKQKTL